MDNKKRDVKKVLKVKVKEFLLRTMGSETQESFARKFDSPGETQVFTDARTLRKYTSGKVLPQVDKLYNLAKNLGITIDEIFRDEDSVDDLLTIYSLYCI